jgi:hypothetical protein
MYPAEALEKGLYSVADLPDEILVTNLNFGLDDTVFNKTGNSGIFYTGTASNGSPVDVKLFTFFNLVGIEKTFWRIHLSSDSTNLSFTPECLISPSLDESPFTKDTFANTYTATSPGGESYILTRVSLCVWIGPEPDLYNLQYFDDSASEPLRCKWAFIDSIKDAGQFQNTPTGNYTQPLEESPWIIS